MTELASLGAYGLTLNLPTPELLNTAPAHWPTWSLEWLASDADQRPVQQEISETRAVLRLSPIGHVVIDRGAAHSAVRLPVEPDPRAWVHPHLGSTAVMCARWHGRLSFHAGSFVLDDRVWAVLGAREAGKSSLLAWQHLAGHAPFADDLLVTDGQIAYAGPRCIDLRETAHRHFGIGESVGVIGTRERWRQPLSPVASELPLAGFVLAEWGVQTELTRVDLADRIRALAPARGILVGDEPPAAWMAAIGLPMLRFRRPMQWFALDESMEQFNQALREA